MPRPRPGDLDASLGYRFQDAELRERALRHSSVGGQDFQRLEYLGDAALSLAVALSLYERHGDWDEGQLTKVRAALVRKGYLVEIARRINLEKHLRVSGLLAPFDQQQEGHGVLADAVEALLGAVMLDGGMPAVLKVVAHLFDEEGLEDAGHPKSVLQEWFQARGLALPEYREISRRGVAHAPQFEVECELQSPAARFVGQGRSLKSAELEAASRALEYVKSLADQ